MKKLLITLFAICSFGVAFAQNSPVILTVDVAKLYDGYWKAQEAEAKLQSSVDNATQEIQAMITEGMEMTQKLQELQAEASSPAISDERRKEISVEAQSQIAAIQKKEQDVNQFRQATGARLQQRRESIVKLHLSDIQGIVAEVAKEKGADLVLNTQGIAVVYASESMNITNEVLAKLGKSDSQ